MGIFDKIFAAGRAIQAGESLKNPATWKNVQLLTNAITILLGAVLAFVPLDLTPDDIAKAATGLSILAGAINKYFTVATSEKVGIHKRR